MATSYDSVYDLALMMIDDYELTRLYNDSQANFYTYMKGLLILSIPDFHKCKQDLSNRSDSTGTFNVTLTDLEKSILASLMTKYWLKKKINDATQIQNNLQTRDFKTFSQAENLKEKKNWYMNVVEEINHMITMYVINDSTWLPQTPSV